MEKTIFIESKFFNPYYNLALEQYAFDALSNDNNVILLWRNEPSIIIGRYQNTVEEINCEYVRKNNIKVARRLSGGGAMYQDLGNINYTIITHARGEADFDLSLLCRPIVDILNRLEIPAEQSGRNDILLNCKKISGTSAYMRNGKIMHHGTLLYNCDLTVLAKALTPSSKKFESKGIKSVRARVANIGEYFDRDVCVEDFMALIKEQIKNVYEPETYALNAEDKNSILSLASRQYEKWSWIYGESPNYSVIKERKFEGRGTVRAYLEVSKGIIEDIGFYGDFFGNKDTKDVSGALSGVLCKEACIRQALETVECSEYFSGISAGELALLMAE